MSKTTLDLSTLSDISDGIHTVKVKAKADRYSDSEFSNEVGYTKANAKTANIKTLFLSNNKVKNLPSFTSSFYIKFNSTASIENYDIRVRMNSSNIQLEIAGSSEESFASGTATVDVNLTAVNNISLYGVQSGTDSLIDCYIVGQYAPSRYERNTEFTGNFVLTEDISDATLNIIQSTD